LGVRLPNAAAYNRPVFDRVLSELPGNPSAIALWLRKQGSLDDYLDRLFAAASTPAVER